MLQKNIGTEKGWQKIRHYCSYQERNHVETRDKLYSFGLYKHEVETLLSRLIEENYLNEERFAIAFAGGKFRMKQWGRVKIKYELQQKRISPYCIKKAIASIPEDDYASTLEKLYKAKLLTLKSERNIFVKKTKVRNYLMQKGYEPAMIMKLMDHEA